MIKLFQYYPCWGMPNGSPFCIKLETFLRMVELPHEVVNLTDPRKSPKHKLPYIEDNGTVVSDSGLIVDYLTKKYDLPLDDHLTAEQRATAMAFQRLMEEHLYWNIVYGRWVEPENWSVTKKVYFGSMPALLQKFVPEMLRKNVVKDLRAHGLGRHSPEDIYAMGCADVTSLATFLGEKTYCFNEQPSSLDAIVFAFVMSILYPPLPTPLQKHTAAQGNLKAFCDRMQSQYFPELTQEATAKG